MTDVADRHWGTSLVRAPTAKDAAHPDDPAPLPAATALPAPGTRARRGAPTLLRNSPDGRFTLAGTTSPPPAWEPAPGSTVIPAPPTLSAATPAPAPAPTAPERRQAPPPPASAVPSTPDVAVRRAPVLPPAAPPERRQAPAANGASFHWPVTEPAVRPSPPAAEPPADPCLARLARGIQDCARALECLADRIDGLERRFDAAATAPSPRLVPTDAVRGRSAVDGEGLENRFRILEGMVTGRLQALDQRVRRLEILPVAVGRLQQETTRLSELAWARRVDESGRDLTSAYEPGSVAEPGPAHPGAAGPSLEQVRSLERAVLQMGRHLDRNLAEHTRQATSDQAVTRALIDRLDGRLTAAELSRRPIEQ